MTYRRLAVLIEQLPGDSAYKTAVRDAIPEHELAELAKKQTRKGHGPITGTDLRIADLIDEVRLLRRELLAVNGVKPPGEFQPYPRPGVTSRKRTRLAAPQLAYLQRIREQHERLHGDTDGQAG